MMEMGYNVDSFIEGLGVVAEDLDEESSYNIRDIVA